MTDSEVKELLGLQPHPREGGWFIRTYASDATLSKRDDSSEDAGSVPRGGPRPLATAIYYLLEPSTFSEMHRLTSDELFHHYGGGPVEMLQLWPDGEAKRVVLGGDLAGGQRPQVLVPGGVWQGSRLLSGDGWALLGCTVSPGFEYSDYESGSREELLARWPEATELILALTHR